MPARRYSELGDSETMNKRKVRSFVRRIGRITTAQ